MEIKREKYHTNTGSNPVLTTKKIKIMKKKQQISNEIKHIFERGDIISNASKKDVRLILKAENRIYYFINLKSQYFNDIFGKPINIEKGSESNQFADIVEKHFYLVEF